MFFTTYFPGRNESKIEIEGVGKNRGNINQISSLSTRLEQF